MKKTVVLLFFTCLLLLKGYAQADNYALKFSGKCEAVCGTIHELEGASTLTLEAWVHVDNWTVGGSIAQYGANFALTLGDEANGELTVSMLDGDKQAIHTVRTGIKKGEWHLITFVFQGDTDAQLAMFVDAQPVAMDNVTSFPSSTSQATAQFTIGNGFVGSVDEIRLWKKALMQKDILLKSTASPYHNSYSDLMGYWKCDQFTSPGLVDYSNGAHHGTLANVVREQVKDNAIFRYRPITGYLSLNAVAQGILYDKQQLVMCNDIVLFGLTMNSLTGEVTTAYPDYPASLNNAEYAASFTAAKIPEGAYVTNNPKDEPNINRVTRDAVLQFKGEGAQLKLENLNFASKGTFETWFYVNTWKEGTALFEKKAANGDEVSLKMGATDGAFIFTTSAMVGGTRYTEVYPFETLYVDADAPTTKLSTATTGDHQYWHFLSFVFNQTSKDIPVSIYYDGFVQGWPTGGPKTLTIVKSKITQNGQKMPIDALTGNITAKVKNLPTISEPMLVGKDLDGYMDEISFWAVDRTTAQRQRTDALNVGLDLGKQGAYYTIQSLQAYYPVMDAKEPIRNHMCMRELFGKVTDLLEDNRGYKIRMTAMYTGGSWQEMMKNPTIRDKAAINLAKAVREFPYYKLDGLDVDFEWATSDCQAGYGLFLKKIREELGPDAILSVASNGGSQSWYAFTKEAIDAVDYITSQDYGPHKVKFTYDSFLEMHANYKAYELPGNKIMLSYGAYAVGEYQQYDSTPYRNFAESVPDELTDQIIKSGEGSSAVYFNFTGINQTRKRTQYILDNNLYGMMYYDIVCDVLPTHPKSLTRSMAQVLASNNELIVKVADPTSLMKSTVAEGGLKLYPSPIKSGEMLSLESLDAKELVIYSVDGKAVLACSLTQVNGVNQVKIDLVPGIYVAKAGKQSARLIVTE